MCTLGAGALFVRGPVHAQAPTQAATENKRVVYTTKTSFRMPVQIKDEVRAQLKEVCLYVKSGKADWVRQETAVPTVQFFNYRVPRDGEYCFSVATIDKHGTMTPPDIGREEPGLRVIVDTQPPTVELKILTAPDNETCVLCVLQDEHPDLQSIKITYRGPNNAEQVLEPHVFKAGLFRVPTPEIWGSMVRVTAQDKCGNKVQRDLRMPLLSGATQPVSSPQTGSPYSSVTSPSKETVVTVDPPPSPSLPPSGAFVQQAPAASSNVRQPEPARLPFHTEAPVTDVTSQRFVASSAANASGGRQLLNTTHASVDYRIDKVGPSGIGKIEIWMTPDNGKTWQRLREDADRRSPAEIDLPGEGLFGIRLVVTNGNGFGGSSPKSGDAPSSWIEIDTTPPFVQLRDIDPVTDGGTLHIRWNASDKNLGTSPVNLYYRTQQDAAWEIMAKDLQNTGSYLWAFPHSKGSQFFIGIEVIDRAGNVMRAESPNAVTLDMTEPSATVVGITGVNARQR
jgi:hypothetical protein